MPVAWRVNFTGLPGTVSLISCGCVVTLGGLAVNIDVQNIDVVVLHSYSKYKNTHVSCMHSYQH